MNENTIQGIREALRHSPDNIPLRMLLAENLLSLNRLEEAEAEYTTILKTSSDPRAKQGLARVYFRKGNFSACNVILEEVIEEGNTDIDVFRPACESIDERKFHQQGTRHLQQGAVHRSKLHRRRTRQSAKNERRR